MQIIIKDLDPEKDKKILDFLTNDSDLEKSAEVLDLITDADFEDFFTKVAEELKPKNWQEFKIQVIELFPENEKVASHLERWEDKLTLDRTRLKELFL